MATNYYTTFKQSGEEYKVLNTRALDWLGGVPYPSGKIFGVKFAKTGAPAGTRTDSAVGLTAAVSTDTTAGVNEFDYESCFMYDTVNGYLTTDGEFVETAIEGDGNFALDGSNGDVFIRWATHYFKYASDDDYDYIQISDRPHAGFSVYPLWENADGSIKRFAYISKYEMGYAADTFCASISGVPVAHNTYTNRNATTAGLSHNTQLTEFRKKGTQYCGMTSKEVQFLQDMFWVEFATRNSQAIMQGCTNWNFQKPIAVAETGVTHITLSNANAAYFPVGCRLSISATGLSAASDRNNANAHTTANRVKVLSKTVGDTNTVLELDLGDSTITTTTTMYASTMPWDTGAADGVLGTSGSPVSNTSGYYPMMYRGVENLYGNVWTIMSDIILKSYQPYICYDCTKFSTAPTSNYVTTSYTVCTTTNSYAKAMGSDTSNPSVRLPITVGGSASTYYCDNWWIASGTDELLFGGSLHYGAAAGVSYWSGYNGVGFANWYIAARLSVSGLCGAAA